MSEGRKEQSQEGRREGRRKIYGMLLYQHACAFMYKPQLFLIRILIAINFLEASMSTWEYSAKYVTSTGIFILNYTSEKRNSTLQNNTTRLEETSQCLKLNTILIFQN